MSAYLVNNSTISRLADALRQTDKIFGEKYTSNLRLARDLYNLNVQALKERYEDYKDMIYPLVFTSEIWILSQPESLAQFYMSLTCFLYQCSEGKVRETDLYQELRRVQRDLAHKIAMDWAESQGAVWD